MKGTGSLPLILDEIHKRFNLVLKDLSLKDLSFKSEKNSPAIGWIVGHITGGQHVYLNKLLQNQEASHLQEYEHFGTGTSSNFSNNPPIGQIQNLFEKELQKMKETIQNLSIEQLNSPIPHQNELPSFFRDKPLNELLANNMAHVLMHLGQALEIRRMLNKNIEKINY
ncbi:MAG: DinB family protein [Promethearchaeota archaeon]